MSDGLPWLIAGPRRGLSVSVSSALRRPSPLDQGRGCRAAATGTGLRCLARCVRRRDFCDRSGCPERPHRRDAGSEPVGLEPDHRAVDHPWRVRSVMAQGPDECLRAPAPERRVIDKALSAWGPPGGSGHVCLDRGLLYETKMKASLSRWSAMKGRRFVIRMWRRSATSLRFCSRACRSCSMRRPESVPRSPNRGSAGSNTSSSSVISPFAPTRASIQSVTPMRAAIALRSWGQRSRLTPWFHRVIHELRRSPKNTGPPHGDRAPRRHRRQHAPAPPSARLDPPYPPQQRRTASQAIRESSTSNAETRSSRCLHSREKQFVGVQTIVVAIIFFKPRGMVAFESRERGEYRRIVRLPAETTIPMSACYGPYGAAGSRPSRRPRRRTGRTGRGFSCARRR